MLVLDVGNGAPTERKSLGIPGGKMHTGAYETKAMER